MKTEPPQRSVFSVEATQWMIFDAYMAGWEKMQREEMEEAAKGKQKEKKPAQVVQVTQEDPVYSASMKRCLKVMERLIVQNANEERFIDYKYEELTMEEYTSP